VTIENIVDRKPKFEDYEPLTRSRGSKDDYEEKYSSDVGFQPDFKSKKETEPTAFSATESRPPASFQPQPTKVIFRRGHALSTVGLFLFTFVLYFRPYEIIPALSFMSNIAFWLAVVTVLVYVPTQLALEGSITIKVPEVKFVVLLGAATVASIPFAVDPSIAGASVIDYLKVVVIFIVLVNVIRTEKRLHALMALSILAAIISSIYAVGDYATGNLAMRAERIKGFLGNLFDNPNDLALHLVTMVPLVLTMALGTKAISKKILYVGLALLFAGGIVATTSRGGLLGFGLVMAVLGWKLARRYRVVMGGIGLGLMLLIVLFGPGGLKSRIAAGNDASAVNRTDDLKRSVFLSIRHPIVGLGMSCYPLYSNTGHATHNGYTQVSVECGMAALVFYVLFLVTPIRRLSQIRSNAPPGKRGRMEYLMIGIETSIIGYMIASFFLSVAFLWYAYYLVGYAVVLRRLAERSGFSSLGSAKPVTNSGSSAPRVQQVMARDSV